MNSTSANKYAHIEKQIDKYLLEYKILVFPPGSLVFFSVNMLLIFGAAALILTIQDVIFTNFKTAAIFTVVSEVIMSLIIVAPPSLVIWGFRKAFFYLKFLVVTLTVSMSLFTIAEIFSNGKFLPMSFAGLICLAVVYFMVNSPSYILFSLFTARRRELAVEERGRKKGLNDN